MRYRIFGRHTGLRVSELALGAGNFGTRWGHGADPADARKVSMLTSKPAATSSTQGTATSSANPKK